VDPEDGKVYTDIPSYVPLVAPVQTPPSPEWSSGSLPISPSSLVGAKLELYGSILHDHAQRLEALPPVLFEGYARDFEELYTRSGARLVLALKAWEGRVDTQRIELWQARYDDHRLIHDMLVHQAAMQHELQEMRGSVATLEQDRGHR
ncbi:hypothetical protein Tco_0755959, partial [Tanacetum coccineum]